MSEGLQIALQVLAAMIIVIILYAVTLSVLNIDSLVVIATAEAKQREMVSLLDGFATPSYLNSINYNTINPYVENYRRIARSMNLGGGAQFTYSMWVKVENANDNLFKDLIILHKGDNKKYQVAYYAPETQEANNASYVRKVTLPADNWIACPQIRFGESYRDIRVRFNTQNEIYNEIQVKMKPDAEPTSKKNLLSLMPLNWTLLTFVFQDNFSMRENAENGIKFTMYVNDVPYWTESASTYPNFRNDALKQNDGNLFFFPKPVAAGSDFVKIGNVKYYNYAVSSEEVTKEYNAGPPAYEAKPTETGTNRPAHISAYNKIDIYNF